MADFPVVRMTLAQYRQEQEHFLQDRMERLTNIHVQRAEDLLRLRPFCFTPDMAKRTATGVVRNGETLMSNADSDSDSEDDEADRINDIRDELAEKFSVSLLLIQAPLNEGGKSLETDEKSRNHQFKNFVKLHPALKQENPKIHKEPVKTVHEYEEMKKYVGCFIEDYGTKSILASVVFNGHGTEKGLRFDKHEEGSEVAVNTVIADVQTMLKEKRSALGQPDKIELIFSQCYAHLHSQPKGDDITVCSFTSTEKPQTIVIEDLDPFSQDVVDARHLELEQHAEGTHPAWTEANKKMAAQDDDGPCTSIGGIEEGFSKIELEGIESA